MAGWKHLKAALFVVLRPALWSKKPIILSDACRGEIKRPSCNQPGILGLRLDAPLVCRVCFIYPSGNRGLEKGFGDYETHKNLLSIMFTADEMDISFYSAFRFHMKCTRGSGELLLFQRQSVAFFSFNVEIPRNPANLFSSGYTFTRFLCFFSWPLKAALVAQSLLGLCRHLK